MKRNSIMQAGENVRPDVRNIMLETSAPAAALYAPSALTDAQLYRQCKYYGKQAKGWMRKFESLLPEVYRRRLYKRRGFASIHEFAQKLAGMSKEKVDRILQLSKKLEDKPALRKIFESGDSGYTKIARVVYVASSETDVIWAEKVQICSQLELKLLVERERKNNRLETVVDHSFAGEEMTGPQIADSTSDSASELRVSFSTNPSTERKLRALQRELERERGEKLSLGEAIEMLINREHENLIEKAQRKRTISYCPDCVKKRADEAAAKSEITRAVPSEIRHTVLARQNYLCVGGQTCTHPPAELHHLDGWALTKKHDPNRMRYLCKKHHAEIHAPDSRVQAYRS